MTFDGIRVNHAALDLAIDEMIKAVNDIDGRLDRLEGELEPLRSQWVGNAQQSYTIAKAKWDTAIQEMKDLLTETHTSVATSKQEYIQADARGAAQFGG